jgi:eukaryotic-like serine/threonine-protein kinase
MLTARPAFPGATATDIIAKVIEGQPNWDLLPAETPFWIHTLLASTLTKDRTERLQQIDDARVFIKVGQMPMPVAPSARPNRAGRFVTAALGVVLVASLVPASLYFLRTPEEQSAVRFEMAAQGELPPIISPDGQSIAYVEATEGKNAIWIRRVGELTGRLLTGTENGSAPFWSPDSRYVGFFADGRLKKINVTGGPATTLAQTSINAPGAWNREGVILFSALGNGGPQIVRVAESGGAVTPVTSSVPKNGGFSILPQFLPDGRHFLYVVRDGGEGEIYVSSLDGAEPVKVLSADSGTVDARYASPGYLVFRRARALMAQRFDLNTMSIDGEPIGIAEGAGPFSVSDQGTLVYRSARAEQGQIERATQLRWFDRNGKPGASVGMQAIYGALRLSPDGRRAAVDQGLRLGGDIWVVDLDRGVSNRLTFDPAIDSSPVWVADGTRIAFASNRPRLSGSTRIFLRSANGVGNDELLPVPSPPAPEASIEVPVDWSADGRHLVFVRGALDNSHVDIWVKPIGDGKPFPYAQSTSFRQGASRISPNGRWMAYMTNESGTYQIVVRSFPDPNQGKWQISAQGGINPMWRGDGRELYYLALDGKLMVVPVKDGADFEPAQPTVLFQTPLTIPALPGPSPYDVSADGQRFLLIAPSNTPDSTSNTAAGDPSVVTTIVNWTAALRQK